MVLPPHTRDEDGEPGGRGLRGRMAVTAACTFRAELQDFLPTQGAPSGGPDGRGGLGVRGHCRTMGRKASGQPARMNTSVLVASVKFIQGSCRGPSVGSQPTSPSSLCTLHTPASTLGRRHSPGRRVAKFLTVWAPYSGPSAQDCAPRCPGPRLTPPHAQPRAWSGLDQKMAKEPLEQ